MKSNYLIKDERTIYSLTMVLILYEVYKSEYLISDNILIRIIKIGLLILISTQLIFLYLCGLSLAKLKEEYQDELKEIAISFYSIGFQFSIAIFLPNLSFGLIYYYFKDSGYFFTLWCKILLILITFIIAYGTIHIRKKYFDPELEDTDLFYIIIGVWVFAATIFVISKILQAG